MSNQKDKMQGLEITTFKLHGCTLPEFLIANADIDEWLQRQSGFHRAT